MAERLCPIVVGRAHEIDVLRHALDEAGAGRGGVVFLVGEAGIGKSRLAREIVALATGRGARVLRGRAVAGSAHVAFRPLAEALGAAATDLSIDADDLAPWLPALSAVVPGLGRHQTGPADDTAAARGEAVLRALRALTTPAGTLLVLEDLHWADPDTLAVVDHLTDNLGRVPVLCVVTVRSDGPSAGGDLARTVADRRAASVLELARLNDAQVAAMVHACTDGAGTAELHRIVTAADGVPFLVEELLASPGVPRTFAETVHRRIQDLPESDRVVLTAAATLGRHFDWRLLPIATSMEQSSVLDALERAVAAQLITFDGDDFRFRHALTRDAVLADVLPPRRATLALAVWAAVEAAHPGLDGIDGQVAADLAERAGLVERAGELYLATGLDALGKGALRSATAALEQALNLLPTGDRRIEAIEALVDAFALAGRVDDALAVARRLTGQVADDRAARVRLRLAEAAIAAARWTIAEEQLGLARSLIHSAPTTELHALLAVREAEVALGRDDPATALLRAEAAMVAAGDGQPEVTCAALQLIGRCHRLSSLARAEAAFQRSLALADAEGLAVWRLRALHELGTIGMLDRGDCSTLYEARRVAEELGAVATAAVVDVELTAGRQIGGDPAEAVQHAQEAVARAGALGLRSVLAAAWQLRSTSAAIAHDHVVADQAGAAARAAAPGDPMIEAFLLLGTDALFGLIEEDRAAAVRALDAGMALLRQLPVSAPAQFRGLWPLVLAVDGNERAPDAVDEVERSGVGVNRLNQGYLEYARAVIDGRTGAGSGAAARVVAGDRHLAHGPFWHHLGRRLVSEAALADGWGTPDQWLAAGGSWFAAHGQARLAEACAGLASVTRPRASRWERLGVTRREGEVLTLVMEGCSNREIAGRLFVSPRTVEKHIESLLRKTGARSRTHLAAVAGHSAVGGTT